MLDGTPDLSAGLTLAAGACVVALAVFLLWLAGTTIVQPALARRFLSGLARSPGAHYAEIVVRFAAGGALVVFSASMRHPDLFRIAGWAVVGTTAVLLCVPWQWHRRFARRVVPPVLRHLWVIGVGATALGAFVLYAAVLGGE